MIVEIAGWIGVVLVLASYAGVSLGWIAPRTVLNQAMNVVGAAGLSWNGYVHAAWPVVALDVAWGVVGAIAIASLLRSRRER